MELRGRDLLWASIRRLTRWLALPFASCARGIAHTYVIAHMIGLLHTVPRRPGTIAYVYIYRIYCV